VTVAINGLILFLGTSSYIAAIWQMTRGKYKPNTFSRIIWLALAINNTAGVILSHGSTPSVLLATLFLVGNIAMCVGSFWFGIIRIGKLEIACIGILLVSVGLWILTPIPLVNLGIGLFAHLIGAFPTLKTAYLDGKSESLAFWSLFFIASLLSMFASLGSPFSAVIFPTYFVLFDGIMIFLCLRRRR
jgi:hypothetical protein